jgi:hypothetical protein
MPDSISSCGDPNTPAARMTSLPARMVRSVPFLSITWTPVARAFSMTTLATCTSAWRLSEGSARPWM